MKLMCAHCKMLSDKDQYVIRRSDSKLYGGGVVYKAIHKRCHKTTLLPAQMVRTARLASVR